MFKDKHEERMKRDISARLSAQQEDPQYSENPQLDHDRMNVFFGDKRRVPLQYRPRSSSQNNKLNIEAEQIVSQVPARLASAKHVSTKGSVGRSSQGENKPRVQSAIRSPTKKELEIREELKEQIRN